MMIRIGVRRDPDGRLHALTRDLGEGVAHATGHVGGTMVVASPEDTAKQHRREQSAMYQRNRRARLRAAS